MSYFELGNKTTKPAQDGFSIVYFASVWLVVVGLVAVYLKTDLIATTRVLEGHLKGAGYVSCSRPHKCLRLSVQQADGSVIKRVISYRSSLDIQGGSGQRVRLVYNGKATDGYWPLEVQLDGRTIFNRAQSAKEFDEMSRGFSLVLFLVWLFPVIGFATMGNKGGDKLSGDNSL